MKQVFVLIFFFALIFSQDFNPERIQNLNYNLAMFMTKSDTVSNMSILNRSISREKYNEVDAIKIVEIQRSKKGQDKITSYIDAQTMMPILRSKEISGKILETYHFLKDNKVKHTDHSVKPTITKYIDHRKNVFLSNSFSEIIQSFDFSKSRLAYFSTFSTKAKKGRFKVERIAEKKEKTASGSIYDMWVLKFTMEYSDGISKSGGYRFVDKKLVKSYFLKVN